MKGPPVFGNVLIALKEDLDAEPLIDLARKAAEPEARLHLVTLVRATREEGPQRLKRAEQRLLDRVRWLQDRGYEATHEVGIVVSAAALDIVRIAEQRESDLVVIGLAKRSRVGKALLGSDSQRVLLASRCPVLVSRLPS